MSSTEQQLAAIWRDVLNVSEVAPDSDFFGLGGDSVATMMMLMRVEEQFSIYLDPGVIYEAPTVALLSQAIETELGAQAAPD
jgi:acyl carrier protein